MFARELSKSDGKVTGDWYKSTRVQSFQLDQPRMTPQGGGVDTARSYRLIDNPDIVAHSGAFWKQRLSSSLEVFVIVIYLQSQPIAMSRASKLTLAATGLGTAGIVYFVHWAQENDRAACSILAIRSELAFIVC